MRLLCAVFGHRPDRRKVWNDNLDFRAPCYRCGAPMLRMLDRRWHLYVAARDDDPLRKFDRREAPPGI